MQTTLPLIMLTGPAALLLAFGVSRADPGLRPAAAKLAATLASLVALIAGAAACAGLVLHGDQSWTAGSGVLQGLGAVLAVTSFFVPEKIPAAVVTAGPVKMHITPTAGARAGGLGAVGTF